MLYDATRRPSRVPALALLGAGVLLVTQANASGEGAASSAAVAADEVWSRPASDAVPSSASLALPDSDPPPLLSDLDPKPSVADQGLSLIGKENRLLAAVIGGGTGGALAAGVSAAIGAAMIGGLAAAVFAAPISMPIAIGTLVAILALIGLIPGITALGAGAGTALAVGEADGENLFGLLGYVTTIYIAVAAAIAVAVAVLGVGLLIFGAASGLGGHVPNLSGCSSPGRGGCGKGSSASLGGLSSAVDSDPLLANPAIGGMLGSVAGAALGGSLAGVIAMSAASSTGFDPVLASSAIVTVGVVGGAMAGGFAGGALGGAFGAMATAE